MKFYKENELNPFASFLPLVAQLPVFIGLYYTLRTRLREDICPGLQAAYRHAYALHHDIPLKPAAGQTTACHGLNGSSWLFIHDLTTTATGLTLVVLILLYVGTQLASSLMMRPPTTDQTQRRMMPLLPLLFVIFIIHFPAGLVLYWITTNTWTIGQQWLIRRRIGPLVPVTPAASPGSSGGRDTRLTPASTKGDGSGAGLRRPLRGHAKPEDKQPAAVGASTRPPREAPPRRPQLNKKNRSGRPS